jgi:hypothetical protein
MKYFFSIIFLVCFLGKAYAQKLNAAEEQIFRAEATKAVQKYYEELPKVIPILKDSVVITITDDDGGSEKLKTTQKEHFITKFFDNHDVYVYNDLSPDDKEDRTAQRVMVIDEYLDQVKSIYGQKSMEKFQTTMKSANVLQIGYNSQAAEKFYYAKIKVQRRVQGMYLGSYFTDNTKELDFYIKMLDKPDTRFKKFTIIGIDYESKQIVVENLSVDETIAKGIRFFNEEDYEKAFKYLTKYSGEKKLRKNENATWALAYMYFWGRGTERSDEEMVKWLTEAADKNNLYALHYLGENYWFGEYGVEEDEKKAFKLIKEAAKKGFAESQYFMGQRSEKGEGMKQDLKDAKKYYQKAAKQGHVQAKYALEALEKKK